MAGEGFPFWMQLTRDDRLMTSLPLFHINAPAYSTLGSLAARASLALLPGFSASTLPRRRPPVRRDRVQQHRRDARDPRAPAARAPTTPTTRSAAATRARRPIASTSSRSRRASASRSCAGTRCRSRRTRSIWRHGERPYGTLGSARQHPDARPRERRARRSTTVGSSAPGEIGRARAAQPGDHARLLRDAGRDRGGDRRRVAAHRRPRARQRRRDLHVPRPQEGSDPPPRREPVAGRGGGRARTPSRRGRSRGDRRAVGAVGGRREGVRGRRARRARPTSPRCTRSPREQLAAFKVPRYIEVVAELPHTRDRPAGQAPAPARAHAGRSGLRRPARAVSG